MNGQEKRRLSVRGRRSGFILITALIVILLGAVLSVGIFTLANSMYTTNLLNRHGYEDQIAVTGLIEQAKGFIVARNVELRSDDKPVLHGRGAAANDYFPIHTLNDLQVCTPPDVGDVLSREVALRADHRGVARRLRLQVYDANYRVGDVRFTPTPDMPPSLYPSHVESNTSWGSGGTVSADYYRNYGAYLVRVELFRDGRSAPLRRTEMAFFQYVDR